MPENVGCITELIANYCYKGLSHTVLEPNGVPLLMSCSPLDINVVNFYMCHGDILTVVIMRYFRQ